MHLEMNGYVTKLEGDRIEEKSVTVLNPQTCTNNLVSVRQFYEYSATVWLCMTGAFTYDANLGSPYYVNRSNNAGVLYGIRARYMPSHITNQWDDGAVFVDIIKYLPWIITTAHGPIGQGYSGMPQPAIYIKHGDSVHNPDTGQSWRVKFHRTSHLVDLHFTCNQRITHLIMIGGCFHDPAELRCYWEIIHDNK